jgi:prevent-host-death family protein
MYIGGTMTEATITELRKHLQRYLARVARGEEVRITRRGQLIARVVGCPDSQTEAREALAALRARAVVGDVTAPIDADWSVDAPA